MALAEEPTSTELVPTNGALAAVAQIEEIERQLPEALERGDTDWLLAVARKADVAALWARREGYLKEANCAGRLRVRAEACLGLIDRENHPTLTRETPPLMCGGEVIAPGTTRRKWRGVGVALERGVLDKVMDCIEQQGRQITTKKVADDALALGAAHVPIEVVQGLVRDHAERTGVTRGELATELGLTASQRASLYVKDGKYNVRPRVEWKTARAIALALGEDLAPLPLAPVAHQPQGRRAPLWLTRERKPSKGPWGAAYGFHRRELGEIKHVAAHDDPKCEELYKHLYWVEEFLGKKMKEEAYDLKDDRGPGPEVRVTGRA